jgi:hypothetical protein
VVTCTVVRSTVPSNIEATIGLADRYIAVGDAPTALAVLDAHPAVRPGVACDVGDAQTVQLWFNKAQLHLSLTQWDPFARVAQGLLIAHVSATAVPVRRRQRATHAAVLPGGGGGGGGGDDAAHPEDIGDARDDGDAEGVTDAAADGGASAERSGAQSATEASAGAEVGRSVVADVLTEEGDLRRILALPLLLAASCSGAGRSSPCAGS